MYKDIKFARSIFDLKDLWNRDLPEIILCGRSNVGKSTFINSLFNKKSLAKTSSTPGKTRSINFYSVEDKFYMVDLPGYGYAKASKTEREKWGSILSDYILKTKTIVHALHIIDSRHTPGDLDIMMNDLLKSAGLQYTFILSKVDKLNSAGLNRLPKNISEIFPESEKGKNLFLYSSQSGKYKSAIFNRIESLFSHS
jgi:GTP-binding protein